MLAVFCTANVFQSKILPKKGLELNDFCEKRKTENLWGLLPPRRRTVIQLLTRLEIWKFLPTALQCIVY